MTCYECEHSTWCPAHDGEPAQRAPHFIYNADDVINGDLFPAICEGCPLCEEEEV